MFTPTLRFWADVVCWTVLSSLLVISAIVCTNPVAVGALSLIALGVIVFAIVYNTRNARTLLRMRRNRLQAEKEYQAEQEMAEQERIVSLERDADFGRAMRQYIHDRSL